MIEMGLQAAKERMTTELQAIPTDEQEVPYDPEAVGSILDLYLEGVQSMLANTSSIRIALDVEDGFVRFTKFLIPKQGSSLAGFVAAQKGGLPEIARFADPEAAMYMAGNLVLTDETRQLTKVFVESYVNVIGALFGAQSEDPTAEQAQAGGDEEGTAISTFWDEYMEVMEQFTDRWVDCMRGDVVGSFDLAEGHPVSFMEVVGINAGQECETLLTEVSEQLGKAIEESDELSAVYTMSEGPQLGDSQSMLMTIDMMKMLELMNQSNDPQAEAVMKGIYGEKLTIAMSTVGGNIFVTGGDDAVDRLREFVTEIDPPANAPSFAPLSDGPGFSMVVNLGRILTGIIGVVPEGEIDLDGPADALNGEAGRIPMGIRFDSESASFELAVSLKTIETITAIVEEERAKKANADAAPVTTNEESN
jgi:hypothetical protein